MPRLYAIRIPDDPLPEAVFDTLASLIEEQGRERLKRFRLPADALRSLVARLTATWYLYTNGLLPTGTLPTFGRKGKGKPTLVTPVLSPPLEFNNTHESSYVLFAALRSPSPLACTGVDVMLPPFSDATEVQEGISLQLTLGERQSLSGCQSEEDRAWRLTLLWSLKEAFTKAVGEGITFGMERIEVLLDPSDPENKVGAVRVDGKDVAERGWEYRVGRVDGHGYAVWWRGDEEAAGAGEGGGEGEGHLSQGEDNDGLQVINVDWKEFERPLVQLAEEMRS